MAAARPLAGATVPTGYQQYHVIGHEQHIFNFMQSVWNVEGGAPGAPFEMRSVVSAVASADGQVIYYDHWEDGFDPGLVVTFPTYPDPQQASTLVFGDGIQANGRVCDFSLDPRVLPCLAGNPNADRMFEGTPVNLDSDGGLAPGCTAGVRCSVPIPRTAAAVRFDGGDYLVSSGGPLSMIHNQDPNLVIIGGATEMMPRQAVENAFSYTIPIGEDLCVNNACDNTVFEPFKYVYVDIVAFEDGTQVFVNSPLANNPGPTGGTVSVTLNRGQHYSSQGLIDTTAAAAVVINSGTKISSTKPIAAMTFTAGTGTFATDFFAVLPDLLHGTDYMIPSVGDNPGVNGDRPKNLYIFNPDPVNTIQVTTTDSVGSRTFNVPPASARNYFSGAVTPPANRYVPANSTVRLTSTRAFWGVGIHDHQGVISDWGYSWLPRRFLTNTYTSSFAPGRRDPAANPPPSCAPVPCNTTNRAPLWVAATLDNTRVQVDFNNDDVFDVIDTNGDDQPDAAPLPNNTYLVSALQALRVYDYTDYDNTGTRVVANKPVSVAYGQDTDQGENSDNTPDTGYVVFPLTQLFLDPVLTLDKLANPVTVPASGGPVTYTVGVQSYGFGPLTNLTVFDDLPAGVAGTDYVPGSTLITYPDLQQSNLDPVVSSPSPGRFRLTWTLSPDTLNANSTLTIRYTVNIPAGPAGLLTNEAHAAALLGASRFEPLDTADVVRTDVTLSKTATDDAGGAPTTGSELTFSLTVRNNGPAEAGVTISDAIPVDTTFVPGSITSAGPFTGSYSVAQNAVVWTAANFGANTGPFTLTFRVTVNPGVAAGTVIRNQAGYESTQTPYFPSNETQQVLVGPALEISKSGTPTPLHPGQQATFTISVRNTGTGPANSVEVLDPYPANTTYVAGSMEWQLNSGSFTALTDVADADQGEAQPTRLRFLLTTLGPGQDFKLRFRVLVNAATGGQFVNNQATVGATEVVPPRDTNLVQIPILGNATITGHVFFDQDRDGVQDPDEPNLPNVTVNVRDTTGVVQQVTTDAFGNYAAVVPAFTAGDPFAQVQLDPDQTDPDVPPGSTLTTGNDPQNVTPVANATTGSTPVGYGPVAGTPLISLAKSSNAPNHEVYPGLVVTYTVTLTNYDAATQTGISVDDPLPPGTSFVAGSTQVLAPTTNRAVRVTEYYLGTAAPDLRCGAPVASAFTGTTCSLNLAQALQPNYFVIVQGANNSTADTGPDDNYVALTADGHPGGTGDLGGSGSLSTLTLTRGASPQTWVGVVTVVECLGDCTNNGFRLLDVRRPALGTATAGTAPPSGTSINWSDITRVVPFGGANGSGCNTADGAVLNHRNCHVRLNPSGANTINWTRDNGAGALVTATPTIMVVEWGSAWDVQRGVVSAGAAGANGANTAGAYNTAAIAPVTRYRTWVWGTGHTNDDGVGDSAEGVLLALGAGFGTQNATESTVAAGIEFNANAVNFDIYTMSHPNLQVDYRFLADGNSANTTVAQATDPVVANSMALVTNGGNGTTNNYSQTLFSARYTTATNIQLERRRSGIDFPAWVQGLTYDSLRQYATTPGSNLTSPTPLVAPADGYQLPSGHTLTVTYQVRIDDPLALGITQVTNTASVATAQNPTPRSASVTDDVIRFGVTNEPNNARFGLAGGFLLYTHDVVNTGTVPDSYTMTHATELGGAGWTVQLLDPDTGAVLASDLNGDGVWDLGVVINTGTLAPGASRSYRVRVNIPGGATPGTEQTVNFTATSNRNPAVKATATDETTVLDITDFGPVAILPDNSGVVTAGNYAVYAHRVINNTLLNDTFDLTANSTSVGWQSRFFYDSNGDGIYTPGIDIQINNTANLPPGGSQLIFVRVDAAAGATPNTLDVTHLTARSRNDTNLFDGATDTTTVVSASSHDLSGGATRLVQPSDIAIHQGTLINQTSNAGRFDFEVTPSSLFGLDGFLHPTELWIDVAGTMTLIASDSNGDGSWDNIVGGLGGPNDQDNDQLPDVSVAGDGTLAYELRRQIPANPTIAREFVTLTAISWATNEEDNVTATDIVAATTRASIRAVHVDPAQGLVEFVTGGERRTLGFELYATFDPYGGTGWRRLTSQPIRSTVRDSVLPSRYQAQVGPLPEAYVWIAELETTGARFFKGPYLVADGRRERAFAALSADLAARDSRRKARLAARSGARSTDVVIAAARTPGQQQGIRVEVATPGIVSLTLAQLQAAGYPGASVSGLAVTVQGQPVELLPMRAGTLGFRAEALDTDFTGTNAYLITWSAVSTHPRVQLTRSETPPAAGTTRVAHNSIYLASAPAAVDPWFWGLLFAGAGAWPPAGDPTPGQFDLPGLTGGGGDVPLRLHFYGYSDHDHTVTASLNGTSLGSLSFSGQGEATLTSSVPLSALLAAGNQLELGYTASGGSGDGYVYLDWLDLDAPRTPLNQPAGGVVLSAWRPDLPGLKGWEYLIVTHADFLPEAQRLAGLKAAAGLQTLVVDVQQAYDHYSSGAVEGRAVQRLIADVAKKSRGLRHVLLVGDDTFDTRDFVGSGARSFVPSLLAHDGEFGRVPSDNLYADLNGDQAPELSIGRLPVQTLAEAGVVVDKVQNQDASMAAYNGRHLFVVDNDLDTDAPFRAEADTIPALLPELSTPAFADLTAGLPATRAALEAAWAQGQMAMHYFGHGGPEQWADEPLLTVSDVGSFPSLPTVLFTWGCETQWYQSLDGPALNERLLLEPGGGVLASFGPVGVTSPAAQQYLYKAVYARVFAGQSLGGALRDAKRAVILEHGEAVRRAVEGFNFFGDPALVLPSIGPKPE